MNITGWFYQESTGCFLPWHKWKVKYRYGMQVKKLMAKLTIKYGQSDEKTEIVYYNKINCIYKE